MDEIHMVVRITYYIVLHSIMYSSSIYVIQQSCIFLVYTLYYCLQFQFIRFSLYSYLHTSSLPIESIQLTGDLPTRVYSVFPYYIISQIIHIKLHYNWHSRLFLIRTHNILIKFRVVELTQSRRLCLSWDEHTQMNSTIQSNPN